MAPSPAQLGPSPYDSNPRTGGTATLHPVVAIVVTIIWTVVSLRMFTRGYIVPSLGWDDFSILIATLFYTTFAASVLVDLNIVTRPGFIENLSLVSTAVEWRIVSETFYILTMLVFKLSLGLFFLRITTKTWHRRAIYAIVGLTTTYGIAYFFFAIFQCGVPKSGLVFAGNKLRGRCFSNQTILGLGFTHAAVSSVTDWAFALFPIVLIYKAPIQSHIKATVGFIVVLGAAGSVCSLVRFKFIHQLAATQISFPDLALWSLLEVGIGILANSLAALRPFVKPTTSRTGTLDSPSSSVKGHRRNWSGPPSNRNWFDRRIPTLENRVRFDLRTAEVRIYHDTKAATMVPMQSPSFIPTRAPPDYPPTKA